MKRKLLSMLLMLSLAGGAFGVDLPDLGDVSQQGMTPAQEREIGENAMKEIRASGDMLEDPEVVAYINRIGNMLVDAAEISSPQFTFFVLQDPVVNAFAMPGGYVGVHSGLIVQTQHESELASVMAHEIAHVSQHHIARLVDGTKETPWMSLASIGLAILAAQAGRGDLAVGSIAAGTGLAVQRQLDFTYQFEQEADRIGMQTLEKSGFDPHAMATFFERLQNYNRVYENNAPEFLRTHPVTYKRISEAQSRAAKFKFKQVPDSAEYLFMREKCRTLQMNERDAISFYQKSLDEKRYASEGAARYGLAYAQYRARQYDAAALSLKRAETVWGKSNPAFDFLAGSILIAQGKSTDALTVFRTGVQKYPASRALLYGEIDAMTEAGKLAEAKALFDDSASLYASDALLYKAGAKLAARMGNGMQQHAYLAEYYIRMQETGPAIEQLQLALKEPGNDFYLLSGVEARLKELRLATEPPQKGGAAGGKRSN